MSREIKFRGKRVDTKDWVYGYYVEDIHGHIIFGKPIKETGVIADRVIPETVGQYTGLRDRYGIQMYEDDIVKYKQTVAYDPEVKETSIEKIIYKVGIFFPVFLYHEVFYDFDGKIIDGEGFEVIGNKFDNPELLEEEN